MTLAVVLAASFAAGFGFHVGNWTTGFVEGFLVSALHRIQTIRNGEHRLPICEACGKGCAYCGPMSGGPIAFPPQGPA